MPQGKELAQRELGHDVKKTAMLVKQKIGGDSEAAVEVEGSGEAHPEIVALCGPIPAQTWATGLPDSPFPGVALGWG